MKIINTAAICVCAVSICAITDGRAQTSTQSLTSWQIQYLTNYSEQVSYPAEIIAFMASKEQLVRDIATRDGIDLGPNLNNFYKAINAGRVREAERIRFVMVNDTNSPVHNDALNQVNLDIELAYQQFAMGDPGLVAELGKDYMDSLPANCIYFGGTDPGRGLPTALCRAPGDPIFVLTQNALCTRDYIQYVRDLYGSQIKLPKPDEVKVPVDGDWGARQMTIMKTNALIAKAIFDMNPDREFYYEQSFPLDLMYPYLSPHGVVMRLNRTPLESISIKDVEQDMEFWSTKIKQLQSNPKFATDYTRKPYSHLRCSIAGLYSWRAQFQNTTDGGERQRMFNAAEKAFRQSLELFSNSPEAVYGFVNLEIQSQKFQAALDIAKAAAQAEPANQQISAVVQQIEQMIAAAKQKDSGQMEKEFNSNPTNFTTGLDLVRSYLNGGQTNKAYALMDQIVGSKDVSSSILGNVAQIYAQQQNLGKLEMVLARMTEVTPNSPEPWYDLAALRTILGKKSEALATLKKSLELSSQRLKSNPAARNLAEQVMKDPRFNSLKNDPDFESLLTVRTALPAQ